jgi:hypothetical protein
MQVTCCTLISRSFNGPNRLVSGGLPAPEGSQYVVSQDHVGGPRRRTVDCLCGLATAARIAPA